MIYRTRNLTGGRGRASEQGGDALIPEGQAAVGGEQDEKSHKSGASCWASCRGCFIKFA